MEINSENIKRFRKDFKKTVLELEEKYDINGYRPKEETEKRIIEPKEK